MFPPRTNSIAKKNTPNTRISGGRVGIPKCGLASRTRGLTMNRGHHGFICSTSKGAVWRSAFKTIVKCTFVLAQASLD